MLHVSRELIFVAFLVFFLLKKRNWLESRRRTSFIVPRRFLCQSNLGLIILQYNLLLIVVCSIYWHFYQTALSFFHLFLQGWYMSCSSMRSQTMIFLARYWLWHELIVVAIRKLCLHKCPAVCSQSLYTYSMPWKNAEDKEHVGNNLYQVVLHSRVYCTPFGNVCIERMLF